MPPVLYLILSGALALPMALGLALIPETPRNPRDIVYDYGVTSYCGTLSPEVEVGFKRELAAVQARFALSEADAKAARIQGWVAADAEWNNRGLGGYRAWCESEGIAAAKRFLDIARGRLAP
jgi:hypothetical protein